MHFSKMTPTQIMQICKDAYAKLEEERLSRLTNQNPFELLASVSESKNDFRNQLEEPYVRFAPLYCGEDYTPRNLSVLTRQDQLISRLEREKLNTKARRKKLMAKAQRKPLNIKCLPSSTAETSILPVKGRAS